MHAEMANRLPNIIRKWAEAKANFATAEPHNFREWARVERTIDEIIYELSMGFFDSFGVYEYRSIRDAANRLAEEMIAKHKENNKKKPA